MLKSNLIAVALLLVLGGRADAAPADDAFAAYQKGDYETALQEFVKERLAKHKYPRHIEFVDAFPMTITGKIQKFVMREQTVGKLGLKEQKTA